MQDYSKEEDLHIEIVLKPPVCPESDAILKFHGIEGETCIKLTAGQIVSLAMAIKNALDTEYRKLVPFKVDADN